MNSLSIKLRISILAVMSALCLSVAGIVLAQRGDDARIELAAIVDDIAVIHLAIPRGQSIDLATLTVGGETISLEVDPEPLAIEQWILLDAGVSTVNVAAAAQAEIERFLVGKSASTRTGLIIYAEDVMVFQPTTSVETIELWLSDYNTRIEQQGCISDALRALAEQPHPVDRTRRALVVAGEFTLQGRCKEEGYINTNTPIDMVIVSGEIDDVYQDIVDRSGGKIHQANIRTLEQRVNEIKTLWTQPAYSLSGVIRAENDARATLQVILASGTEFSLPVQFQSMANNNEQGQTGALLTMPQVTLPATDTPEPTPTHTSTATPTRQSSETPTPPLTETTPPATATSTNSSRLIPPVITETVAETEVTEEPVAQTRSTESAAIAMESTPSATTSASIPPTSMLSSVWKQIRQDRIIMVALVGIVVMIFALTFLLARQRKTQTPTTAHISSGQSGKTEIDRQFTAIDEDAEGNGVVVQSSGRFSYNIDATDIDVTDALEQDDYQVTEMVSEEELLASLKPINAMVTIRNRITNEEHQYSIKKTNTSVGRSTTSDIVIKNDPGISRNHIDLEVRDERLWLVVKTQNPILLDEKRIIDEIAPGDADVVIISTQHTLQITYADSDQKRV